MSKNKFHPHDLFNCFLILTLLLLISCGGGGSLAGGGIGGTGVIASGPVTAKGSIFVNGVEYDTTTSTVNINGSSAAESDLRRGMVVRVDGNLDSGSTTGTASTVNYEDVVKGPLTSFSTPADIMTLLVLGQTVVVEEGFTFVDTGSLPIQQSLPDFSSINFLEVSGHRDASATNGAVRATYIKIESALSAYEVKGDPGTSQGRVHWKGKMRTWTTS